MDDTPMNRILEASDFANAELRQLDDVASEKVRRAPLPWRLYMRCFFLSAIILSVLYMTYRPSLLRFSMLMSLVSPSRGDSLAWKPEPEEDIVTFAVRRTPSPAEWRLAAGHVFSQSFSRPASSSSEQWLGGRAPNAGWGRSSDNPWNWSDDAQITLRRKDDPMATPAQRPASGFRTRDDAIWAAQAGISPDVPALQTNPASRSVEVADVGQSEPNLMRLPGFAPLAPLPGSAVPASAPADASIAFATSTQEDENSINNVGSQALDMPALPLADVSPSTAHSLRPAPEQDTAAAIQLPLPPAPLSVPLSAPLSVADKTEINVFQLPPLPSGITEEGTAASLVTPDEAGTEATAAPLFPTGDVPAVSETPVSTVAAAPAIVQTAAEPFSVQPLAVQEPLDSVTESRLETPQEETPVTALSDTMSAGSPDSAAVESMPSLAPESSPQSQEDPFAVGSVIVSTPLEAFSGTMVSSTPLMEETAPVSSSIADSAAASADSAAAATGSLRPATTASSAATVEVQQQDWKNQEITAAIPGAYLTIYPKLKFVGLCVPGQGYIRKYNQVAVPIDLDQAKLHAADGRTPYGKYYIARHLRDAAGVRLLLSWPSINDAVRAELSQELLSEVERAWQSQSLPPQDSRAGGGVALSGDRLQQDVTSGGFALEEPHMEEIYTALPDGAWVFIQP